MKSVKAPLPIPEAILLKLQFFLIFTAGIAGLSCSKLNAQAAGAGPQPGGEALQVFAREVVVDVNVTDASGNPVHGLTRDEFTVLDDGKPVAPRSFREHSIDQNTTDNLVSAAKGPIAPGTFTNAGITESARPLNMLLIDSLDTPMATQSILQKRLLDFAGKIAPGTRMAVFALSTTGQLSLVQGFTTDPDLLRKAIKSHAMDVQIPTLEDFGQEPNNPAPVVVAGNKKAEKIFNQASAAPVEKYDANQECGHVAVRGEDTFNALSAIARYVSGMPGRKNLIWYTGLFPTALKDKQGSNCVDFETEFRAVEERLGQAHVALYPVDPRALDIIASAGPGSRIVNRQNTEHLRMESMAENSGGKAFYNNNDLAVAASQAVVAGSNYYSIAFSPLSPLADTRLHHISISLDKPGLTLLYRQGYHSLAPHETVSGQKVPQATPLQTAMMRGALEPTEILFQVGVAQSAAADATLQPGNNADPKEMKPPYRHLTLNYTIDASGIQFGKGDDGNFHGQFEYAVNVYDSGSGKLLNTSVMAAKPGLPPQVYQSILQNGVRLRQTVDVPARGQYVLRIGVHDMTTNNIGAIEVPASSIGATP